MLNILKTLVLTLYLIGLFGTSAGFAQTWNRANNPWNLAKYLTTYFDRLPLSAQIENQKLAWPANHWAHFEGGITYRWTAANSEMFNYSSPNLAKLKMMTQEQRDRLSPAEKYSILIRDYDYTLVKKIWNNISEDDPNWNGICHGVAPASVHYEEPQTVKYTNPDGVTLTFYSSDIKGLLSYYYAEVLRPNARFIGLRCESNDFEFDVNKRCGDVHPASFHILLTNFIGLRRKPLIADIDQFTEVWNHVIVSYEFYIVDEYPISENSAPHTQKRIRVQTSVRYASAITRQKMPVIGTEQAYYLDRSYDYYLDLDRQGRIVGGEWISQLRPDFVWDQPKGSLYGSWYHLLKVYKPIK